MEWTNERPKHEGYYWFLDGHTRHPTAQEPGILDVWAIGDELFVGSFGTPLSDGKYDRGLWFGPIEPPNKPNVVVLPVYLFLILGAE
jgi:hypothetical protein